MLLLLSDFFFDAAAAASFLFFSDSSFFFFSSASFSSLSFNDSLYQQHCPLQQQTKIITKATIATTNIIRITNQAVDSPQTSSFPVIASIDYLFKPECLIWPLKDYLILIYLRFLFHLQGLFQVRLMLIIAFNYYF